MVIYPISIERSTYKLKNNKNCSSLQGNKYAKENVVKIKAVHIMITIALVSLSSIGFI
jgi:hypothetical protein